MTKPILLAILPLTLIACADHTHTIIVDSPCVRVNVDINDYQTDADKEAPSEEDDANIYSQEENEGEQIDNSTEEEYERNEEIEQQEFDFEEEQETEDYNEEINLIEEEEIEEEEIEQEETEQEEIEEEEIEQEEIQQEATLHDIQLVITADDHWEGWINGQYLGENMDFTEISQLNFELTAGHHVLAIKASDKARGINGLIASVDIDGVAYSQTGDGQWLTSKQEPISSWTQTNFDDAAWNSPHTCSAAYMWDGEAQTLTQAGAEWVWHNFDCKRNLGTSWFRLHIIIE